MTPTRREALAGALGLSLAQGPGTTGPGTANPSARAPSNPAASAPARALYAFLWSLYGRHTLTGQQELGLASAGPTVELDYIGRVTGRQPALLGLDYLDPRDNRAVNARAIA